MTKSHILLYIVAVLGITLAAYMYTSTAEAPHGLTLEEDGSNTPEENVRVATTTEEVVPPVPAENNSTLPPDIVEVVPSVLTGVTWQWLHTTDAEGKVIFTPKNPAEFKMQFTADRMSSMTDCNTIGGSYEITGQALAFGPLMTTLMYCEGSDEAVYAASLGLVTGFELYNTELNLLTSTKETMVFRPLTN